ncbi:hypothetical protein [cyanobacterium endosymbiont of Rhopalodia gibberula]|nr:hypothetical protein [cyanobacterium endosymbiont of Rhopalodia gibberula]
MAKVHLNKASQENSKHLVVTQPKKYLKQLTSNDKNKSSNN